MVSIKEAVLKKNKTSKIQKASKIEKDKKSLKTVAPRKVIQEAVQESIKNNKKEKKKVKYIMPSKYIKENIVSSCLNTLEQLSAHSKNKNTIFEDETPIFAEINCLKIQNTSGNIKFILPHPTVASTGEICLITPDLKKGRKIDHEPTVDHWEETLRKADVKEVKTVLPVRQLKVEYDQFELKRRLLTQHDFMMVDTRVINHVSHLLGKMFFKKHNMLIPVRIRENRIKKDIEMGLRTAMLRLSEGATSTIVVGHTGMPQNKVKENVLSLVEQLATKYPGGEANIRSISLKLPLSMSLPLYLTLRPTATVYAPKLTQKKPKHFTVLEDELSTMPGKKVRVAPDGTVHVVKSEDVDMSDAEEQNEGSDDEVPDKKDVESE